MFNSRLIPAFWHNSFRNDTNMKIAHSNQCYVNEPFSLKYTSALNLCQRQCLSRIFMKLNMEKIQAVSYCKLNLLLQNSFFSRFDRLLLRISKKEKQFMFIVFWEKSESGLGRCQQWGKKIRGLDHQKKCLVLFLILTMKKITRFYF